jgi:DNA excision repair protein ERCC-5
MSVLLIPYFMIAQTIFTERHAHGRASWKLPPNFPDAQVADAYFHPNVNDDTTPFEFEVPQLHRIRSYCREILGWTDGQVS